MGLQSALTTALTGLRAAETTIDVVGNNVANSQTVGFKESNVNFATQFLQTQSIGSAPSATSGGTNPRQTGLGVRVAEITPDFTQGTIEISSNPLDVAIQGEGFLIVQGPQGGQFYTRNGQLRTNENNEVITVTGQRVLGFNAGENGLVRELQPLRIPIGETAVAQPTENVSFSGSLVPGAAIGDTPEIIESAVLATDQFEIPDDTNFSIEDINETPLPDVSGVASSFPGGTGPAAGSYTYRAVFVDSNGSEGSISSDFTASPPGPGTSSIDLSGLQSVPTDYTGINLYRTIAGGTGDYYLVGSALDPTGTPTFSVDDAALVTLSALDESSLGIAPYSYYITFADSNGQVEESRPTSLIGSRSINQEGGRIRLDEIPQPVGPPAGDYDEIRIYRNVEGNASTFYEVDKIPLGQTSYIDSMPDVDIVGNDEIDLDGPKIREGTRLLDVQLRSGQDFTNLFQEGELSFRGEKGGTDLDAKTLAIDSNTTVQDLIRFIDQAAGFDTTIANTASSTVDGGGRIQIFSNIGVENAVSIGLSAFQLTPTSTGLTQPLSIPFNQLQAANGEGATVNVVVYDTLGIPLNVRITTVLESSTGTNTFYRWFATSSDNEPITGISTVVGTGLLTFDGNGDLVESGSNTDTEVAIQRNETASQSPLVFDLDFSSVSGLSGESGQEEVSTLNFTRQDGSPPGILTSFAITGTGEINGVFSNGISRTLGQIRLARFTNNEGLQQSGANLYAQGVNSGEPVTGNPGENGLGALDAGAVELSNTDIGQNLIELILASTQYRGGARVISAVQELLDELLALRR
ncbi:MAG: flagellar hook-basal body complex protein [Planctomycetes bacterium]|nr:flagellar hook-basal body complex protein [Planctomycetota bacterium]